MKVLHTSDWHLGHVLKSQDREEEHRAFLEWLLAVLEEEGIDLLLVTGDVFDGANPPATAQKAWYGFLAAASARCPGLKVVVIAGNHDSPARLAAPAAILEEIGATVVGLLPRTESGAADAARILVPVTPRGRKEIGAWVAAIPYLRLSDLPGADAGRPLSAVEGARLLHEEVLAAARKVREKGQALIVTGHCLVEGTRLSGESERKVLGGNLNPLPTGLYPEDVTYVALGHLHFPQPAGGRENVRYAGSPIPLSLDEDRYPHQVSVLELEGERLAAVRSLRVPRRVEILRLPEDGPGTREEVLAILRGLPPERRRGEGEPDLRPFLEVRVKVERANALLNRELEEAADGRDARLVKVTTTGSGAGRPVTEEAASSLADIEPERVFRDLWQEENSGEIPPELLAAFHELVESASRGDE